MALGLIGEHRGEEHLAGRPGPERQLFADRHECPQLAGRFDGIDADAAIDRHDVELRTLTRRGRQPFERRVCHVAERWFL
jgi:hypothetical protein